LASELRRTIFLSTPLYRTLRAAGYLCGRGAYLAEITVITVTTMGIQIAKGSLALVTLPLLKAALMVDYQDGDAFGSEGLDALLEEAYYVPGRFRVAL
jgi:hypothetical protein